MFSSWLSLTNLRHSGRLTNIPERGLMTRIAMC
jgi:hypothetical protein